MPGVPSLKVTNVPSGTPCAGASAPAGADVCKGALVGNAAFAAGGAGVGAAAAAAAGCGVAALNGGGVVTVAPNDAPVASGVRIPRICGGEGAAGAAGGRGGG